MADSDDEYDRKRRDKFRGERGAAEGSSYRSSDRREERSRGREEWSDRCSVFFTTSKYHLASEELLTIITYAILFKHHTLIPVSDPIRKLLNLPNSLPLFLKPSKDVQLHLL